MSEEVIDMIVGGIVAGCTLVLQKVLRPIIKSKSALIWLTIVLSLLAGVAVGMILRLTVRK